MYVDYRRQLSLAIFLVLLTGGLALRNPVFASPGNLRDICVNASHLGIAALGMFLVILIGQIDVSVGAILAICSTLAGLMAKQGIPTPVVLLAAFLAGAVLGGINGLIVAGLRIHSIVVTLGTASIYRGLLIKATGGSWIYGLPAQFMAFGQGKLLGVPFPVITLLVVYLLAAFLLSRIPGGRALFAVGSNPDAARLAGLRVARVQILAFVLVIAVAVMSTLSDTFLTVDNLLNATRFMTEIGLVALGMTLVMITGGIDLSVGAVIALTAVVVGLLIQAGIGAWPAAVIGLCLGALLGALNGFVITRVGLPPIIVTLATLAIYRGVAYGISAARAFPIPDSLSVLGQGYLGPLPVQLLLFLAGAAGVWLVLARTTFGRTLYALGVNETAARFAGLHVDRVKLAAYAVSGLLSAVAVVIFISRVSSAKANAGEGYELDAITIVVLGGGSVAGGAAGSSARCSAWPSSASPGTG
jgi:rhamnose transport system permease protein